jgi:hypothetical protein
MKNLKIAFAAAVLACSGSAYAMPSQVPQTYYDHFWDHVNVVVGNPGYCAHQMGLINGLCWLL